MIGFIRNYTWLCAVCCFVAAIITGANGMRERSLWGTSDMRVVGFWDNCQMLPQIPQGATEAIWAGTVPCADVDAKKEQHAAYTYDVTPTRIFSLEFAGPDGQPVLASSADTNLRLPQTAGFGHTLRIDYDRATLSQLVPHEALRGLQVPILLNIFGICLLGFAWLSHVSHGGQTTGAPTGDWLSRVDLPPADIADQKPAARPRLAATSRPGGARPQPSLRQVATRPAGFGRKS